MGPLFCSSNRRSRELLGVEGVKWQAMKPDTDPPYILFSSYSPQTEKTGPSQGPLTQTEGSPLLLEHIKVANKALVVFLSTHCKIIVSLHFFFSTLFLVALFQHFEGHADYFYMTHCVDLFISWGVQGHALIRAWLAQKTWLATVQFPNRIQLTAANRKRQTVSLNNPGRLQIVSATHEESETESQIIRFASSALLLWQIKEVWKPYFFRAAGS